MHFCGVRKKRGGKFSAPSVRVGKPTPDTG